VKTFLRTLAKFNDYEGRATRLEFWVFMVGFLLFQILFLSILPFVKNASEALRVLWMMVYALMLVPFFSVSMRRLHDAGRTGAWLILLFIPVGWPVLLIWFIWPSNSGWNEYGPQPSNGSDSEN